MPVFAEIVLAVTLCVPSVGGKDACNDTAPESWKTPTVVQVADDWNDCKAKEAVYRLRPGVVKANCRYTRVTGGDV